MNAFTVTGYGWDADVYCPDCIRPAMAQSPAKVHDRHWHGEPGPIFSVNETEHKMHCRACGTEIFTNVINQQEGATTWHP